jgi:chaperone required for assembly of F1-ATPase
MRDLFESREFDDPVEAARRSTGRPLRRRFYERAAAAAVPDGFAIELDGKPINTPARRPLVAPTRGLAEGIAAEWERQRDTIDPATMPLTRLANVIIDGVASSARPVAAEIEKYLASDLLFYRASTPRELRTRQAQHWNPVLVWARERLGADFTVGEGVMHVTQPAAALAAGGAAIPSDPWRLGAIHAATTLTGSALLALVLSRGALSSDEAWQAAHVDEDWNMEQWGRDEMALERRASRFAEFEAAATVLNQLRG